MLIEKNNQRISPFIRWAGGKRWLTHIIDDIIQVNFDNYYEPFLGSAAIFFQILPEKTSFLSDINDDLINTYNQIKYEPTELIEKIIKFKKNKKEYYRIRKTKFVSDIDKAAQFIYLNKTSFNGIYRVNSSGDYNVPYGYRKKVKIFDSENIIEVSKILQKCDIFTSDFEKALSNVKANDLVFLDPPYTVAHENNGFIHYNQKLFSWDDQKRLANVINSIIEKKAYYILTNAVHSNILSLFGKITKPITVNRASTVGGIGASRKKVNEYIFTNCR